MGAARQAVGQTAPVPACRPKAAVAAPAAAGQVPGPGAAVVRAQGRVLEQLAAARAPELVLVQVLMV